jgi:IS5 family transposase
MLRPRDDRQKDLLRPALEAIIDMGQPLVRLAGRIERGFLDERFGSVCEPGPGQPGPADASSAKPDWPDRD